MIVDDSDAFDLVESFDIDDGSLANMSVEQAFVLGVEWAGIRSLLSRPTCVDDTGIRVTIHSFEEVVHTFNVKRLMKMGQRHGWVVSSRIYKEDPVWSVLRLVKH